MSTLFIADLHLHDERPELTRAFLRFLQKKAVHADALYILGDLFEAWIGNDDPSETATSVSKGLKSLSSAGIKIYLQHGNRDFLIDHQFAQHAGVQLLAEACRITPYNKPLLLMHGDQLCLDDIEYQKFKELVRSPQWRQDFLTKPLVDRQAIAADLRKQSQSSGRQKSMAIMDVSAAEVDRIMDEYGVDILIHGHTHRPDIHLLSNGKCRIVLGDWDSKLWYLEWHPDNHYNLHNQTID
ncbi:MAG: UDP-2,3-diacylglucosamine diphosphatase [Motiliproteus sp.]